MLSLFKIIVKWKKTLISIFLITGILAIIFSGPFFITPLYKSSAILYPANIVSEIDASPTEIMLQFLESEIIKLRVIKELDIQKHYKISDKDKEKLSKTIKKFEKRVKIRKSQYEAVKIEVYDKDPAKARNIVIAIISEYNNLSLTTHRKNAKEVLNIKKTIYEYSIIELDSINNSLNTLIKNNNLLEYNLLHNAIRGTLDDNFLNTHFFKNLNPVSQELFFLKSKLDEALINYKNTKEEYQKALNNFTKELTFANIISEARVAEKNHTPLDG